MNKTGLPASLLVALLTAVSAAQTPFAELIAHVPASANAVVLVDAERLLASPQAVKEDWRSRYEQAFASGSITMAPDTERMVLAAQLQYDSMQPQWVAAIADLAKPRSAVEVARATKGKLDPFGNTPAVALREDGYVLELSPKRFAAMSPANRQSVSRWLREIQSRTAPSISPFLRDTLAASKTSAVVMALDLEDAVSPEVFRAKLAASASAKERRVDLDSATKALTGIRGVVLELAITEKSFGRLLIYFRGDHSAIEPIAKQLVQEALAGQGAAIEDIEGWTTQSGPEWISLQGTLSDSGRRRILSLVDNPLAALLAEEATETVASDRQHAKIAAATQQYFKALSSIVDEVRKESTTAETFAQNALWFDRWARRIDALPVLNVDEDLIKFSEYLSTELRNMSAALRGINTNAGERSASVYSSYDADDERRAIRAQERSKAVRSARDMAQELQNVMAKIRKDLTRKYQVEF
jgi:hypothetical protein